MARLDSTLTPRELEVVRLLADGKSNAAIARDLQVSEATIENHLHHIFGKLDVPNRTCAAMYAVRLGLVEVQNEGNPSR